MQIDLNADMGEGSVDIDEALMSYVSSANIACGGHIGDEQTMRAAVASALHHDVRIGAHPSYPDRKNFGRVVIDMGAETITETIVEQVRNLIRISQDLGASVAYFKPHGALYNQAAFDESTGRAVIEASAELGLPFMMLAGSPLATAARGQAIAEGFIDRKYGGDGRLLPRDLQDALISDPAAAAEQALRLAAEVDSLCVHSDTPGAPQLMRSARQALEAAGYHVSAST